MLKVMTIIGTRPETIKMAPIIKSLNKYHKDVKSIVCVTAQHREMLDQSLITFGIVPDYDLNIMMPNQSLSSLTANIITTLDKIILFENPDWILVQGDTTTVMAASLVAYYHKVKLGHVEAGLRSNDKFQPFPEEVNRRIADILADAYFAPTLLNRENLLNEGVPSNSIIVTGNTVIDSLLMVAQRVGKSPLTSDIGKLDNELLLLVTVHRRENFGKPLENICNALARLASDFNDKIKIVYPVHLNPNIRNFVYKKLGHIPNISLIEPVDYESLVNLMSRAYIVLTDSGGIQEEAPSLNKPVLILREVTERPEVVDVGAAKLVGNDPEKIYCETTRLIKDSNVYQRMASVKNPYGDGNAGERIVRFLLEY